MYILPTDEIPNHTLLGVYQPPGCGYWEAKLEDEGTVYDLGRFGCFVDAGAAYLKAKFALNGVEA